jgi:hypothetical protein
MESGIHGYRIFDPTGTGMEGRSRLWISWGGYLITNGAGTGTCFGYPADKWDPHVSEMCNICLGLNAN